MAEQASPPRRGRHQVTGHHRLGLFYALVTVACWSTLPVALKVALLQLDVYTLTWFRFLVALVIGGGIVAMRGHLAQFRGLGGRGWLLLLAAAAFLTANYVTYLEGLDRTTPANAQVVVQLAPVLMALGGLVVFGERYTRWQWLGFATLLVGLGVFFNDQVRALFTHIDRYLAGVGFIVLASVVWALYALAQKQLLRDLRGQTVMAFIYLFASLALLPPSAPSLLGGLDALGWAVVLFCALNTLAAYGSFTAALNHWEASRVSAVLALTPLGAMAVSMLSHRLWPGWVGPEDIGWTGLVGAFMVVAGSMLTSLAGRRAARRVTAAAGPCERPGSVPVPDAETRPD